MIFTNNSNIMVAAMWRSGSTHVAHTLGQMLGWRAASTSGYHGEGMEQQDINPFSAAILFPYGYQVFHQHVWATRRNVELLKAFGVKTVVCYRNIPDTIVSIRERLCSLPSFVIPGLPVYKDWWMLSEEEQYKWLALHAAPWQAQFYATWRMADMPKYLIRYDNFYADQMTNFRDLLQWLDIPPGQIETPLAEAARNPHNLSVGKSGRGISMMSPEALDTVTSIVRSWHWPEMENDLL